MRNVLIANTYFYPLDPKQWQMAQPYPPLATLYAASWLQNHGYEVDFQDNCLEEDIQAISSKILEGRSSYLVIYDDGFNYLTKMCLTTMRKAAFAMIRMAKTNKMKVIVSSSDATDQYRLYHEAGADFVIHGEGEVTLLKLLEQLTHNAPVTEIRGISYRNGSDIVKTEPRPVLKDLDQLPMPSWDLIDFERYRQIWMKKHGYFAINIATTRGCPFKCNWCAKPIYGNRYNSRSVSNVIEEITYLVETHHVQYFWICDDIFGLKPGWVQEFRSQLKACDINIRYKIQSRVDLLLKEDTIDALVESGLDIAWVGAESGSQRILDAMDKGTSIEQIYDATKKLQARGARIGFFLQFGYLGEDRSDIDRTIGMLLDLMPDEVGISVSYPLPGTGFFEKVKQDLEKKSNWKDSDDLDLMFQNTYPSTFYKVLHRYVHYRYRIKRGWLSLHNAISSPSKVNGTKVRQVLSMVLHIPKAAFSSLLLLHYGSR